MSLRSRWPQVVALCLAVLAIGERLSAAAEHIIVLVEGTKASPPPANPPKPHIVQESGVTKTVVTAAVPEPPQRQLTELDKLVDEAILTTSRRYLTADVHTPWQIFHGLLALRHNFKLKVDGQKVSGMEWIRGGRFYRGLPLIEQTPYGGRFHRFTEPYAFEGHPNQFMAILSMSELPREFSFKAGGTNATVTIDDILRNAQMECNDREEITWILWAFARYFPPDAQWVNKYGEPWSMERLVQIQTWARVQEGPCGGCHGLFALSLARNAYMQSGKPLRGVWIEADQKIKRYIAETRALQNMDGSFSSSHYNGPGYTTDFTPRIAASGHILEWLMIGMHNDELEQEWLKRGVTSIAKDLINNRAAPADCGPLYHALHSLILYRQRTRPELPDPTVVEVPLLASKPAEAPATPEEKFTEPKKVEPTDAKPATASEATPPMPKTDVTPTADPNAVKPAAAPSDKVPMPVSEQGSLQPAAPMNGSVKLEKPIPADADTPPARKGDDNDEFDSEFQVPLPPTDD